MKFVGKESTNGRMENNTKDSGKTIRCMERELSSGLRGNLIPGTLLKTEDMGMENSSGRMEENMRESGWRESSMELEFTEISRVRIKKESGSTERELNGSTECYVKYARFFL